MEMDQNNSKIKSNDINIKQIKLHNFRLYQNIHLKMLEDNLSVIEEKNDEGLLPHETSTHKLWLDKKHALTQPTEPVTEVGLYALLILNVMACGLQHTCVNGTML